MQPFRIGDPVPLETFPTVLSGAIERSGLSLEHLQRKLANEGIRVSLSTLSYWRRGRTRPERPESLRAVEVIEEVLKLPHGYLVALLGPRKPRGRWVARGGLVRPHESLWDSTNGLAPVLSELSEPAPGELTYLSVHDQHFLDHNGRDVRTRVRMLIRSEVDHLRSMVVLHRAEETDRALPAILTGSGCAVGRVRPVTASRFTVAEVLFDRSLSAGQTAVFEYEVRWFGQARSSRFSRGSRRAFRDYLAEVNFHPSTLPTSCYAYAQESAEEPEVHRETLEPGSYGGVHTAVQGSESAIHGIRWTW
ncbi:helix-turn-helix domain-containing protein [Actinokineospora globicatena]|uniref:helix-turn-helix domain-containing protein n=1 Tax=Actinokineospora globicatena TaxID=103729 RepID=UPI0020A59B4A|nr:helix-turn-helix transcriptional regulator [Actinokineospora globicatena]MCP2300710.1 hypothetical protein [Actinokineospora globicatena]GLW77665.1 hypothetical protein Aglo01_21470 [Actinokineospora globicatena]GLW84501.1 hypothetical protein Aglo02_21410 [Actinokineospora globicatena]